MQARGVELDHSSLNGWVLTYMPALDKAFGQRKRSVGTSWRMALGSGLRQRPAPGRDVYQLQRSMEILVGSPWNSWTSKSTLTPNTAPPLSEQGLLWYLSQSIWRMVRFGPSWE
jgi:hypothetical protein